jgi:hypothetical protein
MLKQNIRFVSDSIKTILLIFVCLLLLKFINNRLNVFYWIWQQRRYLFRIET